MSRVILFTDDQHFADAVANGLREHDHSVQVHHLSPVDVDDVRDFGADVFVLDTAGNGASVSVRQRLLNDRELQRVPLVVVTNDVAYARLLSAQAMLTRPLKQGALEQLVEQLATRVVV